jgi:hypothetical protein
MLKIKSRSWEIVMMNKNKKKNSIEKLKCKLNALLNKNV